MQFHRAFLDEFEGVGLTVVNLSNTCGWWGSVFTWQVLVNVVCLPHTTPPVVTRAHKKSFPGGVRPPDTPNWSAAVAASEGQEGPTVIALVGRCRGLRRPVFGVMSRSAKISMSSQDDLGQGPACSALAMDPKQMEVRGLRTLGSDG